LELGAPTRVFGSYRLVLGFCLQCGLVPSTDGTIFTQAVAEPSVAFGYPQRLPA
jgi:hypothetical protein